MGRYRMSRYVEKIKDNFIQNGLYQKIVWLGVHGIIIVNEIDKEILIIDPWPSYSKEAIVESVKIDQFTDWLRRSVKNGYTITGIIGTHEHYDHVADIPIILHKLYNECGLFNSIPPIYSDRGTFETIKNTYIDIFGTPKNLEGDYCSFEEVYPFVEFKLNNTHLYYDDVTQANKLDDDNYPLIAGTKLTEIEIGNYLITPYIWDHVSTFQFSDVLPGDPSGNFQRCTALFLKHRTDPEQKRLFIVGSAGEMGGGHTTDVKIETDILLQAVPHKVLLESGYDSILNGLIKYQERNITVKDRIIASHFETFVDIHVPVKAIGLLAMIFAPLLPCFPLLPVVGSGMAFAPDVVKNISCFWGDLEKEENKNRVEEYAGLAVELQSSKDNNINKIYYLNRFLIEYGFWVIVENDDGYDVHKESILDHTTSLPPVTNIWDSDYDIFITKRGAVILFKSQYLANPVTREVHNLKAKTIDFYGKTVYRESRSCNIYRMNFSNMIHFEKEEDFLEELDPAETYNGCAHCLHEHDTDSLQED